MILADLQGKGNSLYDCEAVTSHNFDPDARRFQAGNMGQEAIERVIKNNRQPLAPSYSHPDRTQNNYSSTPQSRTLQYFNWYFQE